MKHYLLVCFALCSQLLFAGKAELQQQLSIVNSYWNMQPELPENTLRQFGISEPTTYNYWITLHLKLVEQTLRTEDVSHLTSTQLTNRLRLLDELSGYWQAGVYPVNDYLPYKNPVFIDRVGTHCAVGYLMQQSGHDALAQTINTNEKFAYVYEIKTSRVKAWADEHGFTLDELAWIQPEYPPTIPSYDMNGGLNGVVNTIVADTASQVVYVGGAFTNSPSGVNCSNVAMWVNGIAGWSWAPLGTGVNGEVHALMFHNNKLYVGGKFTLAGATAVKNVAVYDVTLGQWQAMGQLDSTVSAFAVYNNEVYAAGTFTGFLSKWDGIGWQDVAQGYLYGQEARTLFVWNSKLVIGGNFELATGAVRKHVATYNGSQMGNLGFGTPNPVNDFEFYNGKLYAGCDNAATSAIEKFDTTTGNWVLHLANTSNTMLHFVGERITSLVARDTFLLIGGNFDCSFGMYTFGYNLMGYLPSITLGGTTINDAYAPLSMPDSTVNTICVGLGNTFYGGHFVEAFKNWSQEAVFNHIANMGNDMSTYNSIKTVSDGVSIMVFPNPSSDLVRIQTTGININSIELTDVTGKRALQVTPESSKHDVSVSELPAGIYTVRVVTNNGVGVARLVKN